MAEHRVSMAEIGLIAGTRVILGIGIGLLLAGRLSDDRRKTAGLSLVVAGGLSTIPLVIRVLGKGRSSGEILVAA